MSRLLLDLASEDVDVHPHFDGEYESGDGEVSFGERGVEGGGGGVYGKRGKGGLTVDSPSSRSS